MMWTTRSQTLLQGEAIKVLIDLDSAPMQLAQVFCLWQEEVLSLFALSRRLISVSFISKYRYDLIRSICVKN